MRGRREDPEDRFWAFIDRSGDCWVFAGSLNNNGYGQFWDGSRLVLAHRFSYELEHGPIPEGKELDHLCRTRPCVRPTHLEPVAHAENLARGLHHGPGLAGENHPGAKLDWPTVREIRRLNSAGMSQKQLAARFGVAKGNVGFIVRGQTWREREEIGANA